MENEGGTTKRRMPGGVIGLNSSGIGTDQWTDNLDENYISDTEAKDNNRVDKDIRDTGDEIEPTAKNVGARTTRLRTRNHSAKENELIPAHASTIITPADARSYAVQYLGEKEARHIATETKGIAKLLERAVSRSYASGNKELIDTVQASIHLLREFGRIEWSGGRKVTEIREIENKSNRPDNELALTTTNTRKDA